MLTSIKRFLQLPLLTALVFISSAPQSHAANLSMSNVPLFLGSTVQPNVFFLLDDSGSMDWEILTNAHWNYTMYEPHQYGNTTYYSSDYNWFVDDGYFYVYGGGNWNYWLYMYDNANAYGNTCSASTVNAPTMEKCTSDFPALFDWRFRSSALNVTFYSADVQYKPWSGPCGASGEPCPDMNYFKAWNNPKVCGTCKNEERDLSTNGDTLGNAFKYDVWIDDSGYSGTRPGRGDNFNETGIAAGSTVPDPNGMVDLWDSHIRFTVGGSSILVERISYDPQTSAEPSKGLNETSQTLATLSDLTACYDILGPADNVIAIHNQGATPTATAVGGDGCRTIAETQTNIANWYSYSRRRMYSMKNAITQVIDAQPIFRYGITKFKTTGNMFVEAPLESVIDVAPHNENLKDVLYADKQEGTGTFLYRGLENVGDYFEGSYSGKDTPIFHSCQKNFQIVFTDGYYNDDPPSPSIGDLDGDGVDETAADLAYKYYKDDLLPAMEDNVVPDAGSEKELDPDGDGRTWQHLVTFTVAFGLTGVLTDPDGDGWPDKDVNNANWTNPDGLPDKDGAWGNPVACGKSSCLDKIDDLWHIAWNTNGTYAAAATPEEVVEKLLAAIVNIAGRVGSAAAVALNSGTLNANTRVYQAKFNSIDWSGDLQSVPVKDGDGDPTNDPAECAGYTLGQVCDVEWSASEELEKRAWNSRKVFTTNSDTNLVVPFKLLADLGVDQQLNMRTDPDIPAVEAASRGQDRIDWVLGRETFSYDTGFRARTVGEFGVKKLGDVIASSPEYVGAPAFLYSDTMESQKYSVYYEDKKDRTKMVYVGANDGMLHAFDATTGEEKFAYIPGKLVNKLNYLTSPAYKKSHQYYVDGSPVAFDAFSGSWKTLLVTPVGGGGQTVFAMDVTDPDTFSASDVLWEFDDSDDRDMGLSMGDVTYAKMNNGKWAVIIGNGFNNTAPDNNVSLTGNGVIYILDAFTGALIKKLDTGIGMAEDPFNPGSNRPNGIATVTPIDENGDLKADYLYAGDLFGNVWKVDVTSSSTNSWDFAYKSTGKPKPFFKAVDKNGVAQPITVGVTVRGHPIYSDQNLVLFGTGKYFEVGDGVTSASTQVNTFYSVWDNNTGDQPLRSQMLEHKILTEVDVDLDGMTDWRVTTAEYDPTGNYKIDWATDKGWFIDLSYIPPTGTPEYGERVVRKAVIRADRVIFVTLIPNGDPCGYGGSSWIMEVNAETGSRLPESPFDVNGDGIIDASDLLTISGEDTFVSGTRSKEGIVATPGILNSPQGDELKYFSGTSGNIDVVQESADTKNRKRQSWRQLK